MISVNAWQDNSSVQIYESILVITEQEKNIPFEGGIYGS